MGTTRYSGNTIFLDPAFVFKGASYCYYVALAFWGFSVNHASFEFTEIFWLFLIVEVWSSSSFISDMMIGIQSFDFLHFNKESEI